MVNTKILLAAALLFLPVAFAAAKDLGPDQALKLRDAGTIKSFEVLNAVALAKHPGATVGDTELEEKYGKFIYQVEMRDAEGRAWEVELDAVTATILSDHQDT